MIKLWDEETGEGGPWPTKGSKSPGGRGGGVNQWDAIHVDSQSKRLVVATYVFPLHDRRRYRIGGGAGQGRGVAEID